MLAMDEVKTGDLVEVAQLGDSGLFDVTWTAGKVLAKQSDAVELSVIDTNQSVEYKGVLLRRYPWRFAQLSANDTIEVCTTRGWESANVISVNEGEDSLTVEFADGQSYQEVRPRTRPPQAAKPSERYKAQVGQKVKVQTSKGWEIATVLKKDESSDTVDVEMYPDGETFAHVRPKVLVPKSPDAKALELWRQNRRLRAEEAELRALRSVAELMEEAEVSADMARDMIQHYAKELRH